MRFEHRLASAPSALLTTASLFLAAASIPAAAQTETVLFSFQGIIGLSGSHPVGGLVADEAGNLYGTASVGGRYGAGTVYKLSPPATPGGAWTQTPIYAFKNRFANPPDGAAPQATLVMDERGNLYGTTAHGGNTCEIFFDCGTVFELVRPRRPGGTWQERVLYRFNGADGQNPSAALTWGPGRRLYGTTTAGATLDGGTIWWGAVFELTPPDDDDAGGPWTERVLYAFSGTPDGGSPASAVVFDHHGNLYGTTTVGGALDNGTVFKLTRPSRPGGDWTESILYSFTGGRDGSDINAGVVFDAHGNLIGAATGGGNYGGGTIFQLTPPDSARGAWSENTLYEFTNAAPDGGAPYDTPTLDRKGNIFGTASGGTLEGTVFELSAPDSGAIPRVETTLHDFAGPKLGGGPGSDGAYPLSSLLLGRDGVLYGTTTLGGASILNGTAFEIVPKRRVDHPE